MLEGQHSYSSATNWALQTAIKLLAGQQQRPAQRPASAGPRPHRDRSPIAIDRKTGQECTDLAILQVQPVFHLQKQIDYGHDPTGKRKASYGIQDHLRDLPDLPDLKWHPGCCPDAQGQVPVDFMILPRYSRCTHSGTSYFAPPSQFFCRKFLKGECHYQATCNQRHEPYAEFCCLDWHAGQVLGPPV